ncbi:MAG: hypothetical protein QGF78_03765, partial [Candidatus Bathyarchaeota archaeon]|nr:hypothetical protein [Candidatus Bathyarchaeota archaeon]
TIDNSIIVCEIQNISPDFLDFVKFTVTFYDAADKVTSTAFTFNEESTLKPQDKSPFRISSYPDKNLQVDHYRLL